MANRTGTKIKAKGLLEIWVIPAEANGWRADFFKRVRRGEDWIHSIRSEWFSTKAEAVRKANTFKKFL